MSQRPTNGTEYGRNCHYLLQLMAAILVAVFFSEIVYANDSLSRPPLVERDARTDTGCRRDAVANGHERPGRAVRAEMYSCGRESRHLFVYDDQRQLMSSPTCCEELWWGKNTLALVSDAAGDTDFVIATSGDEEGFLVEIFGAKSGRRISRIWSESPPVIFSSLDRRNSSKIVLSHDIFSIKRPDAPAWPIVINIDGGLVFAPPHENLQILRSSLSESRSTLEEWMQTCRDFAPDPCPFRRPYRPSEERLEAQASALQNLIKDLDR